MASKPLRPCRHPGCAELTSDGYCPAHKPKRTERKDSAEWHWMYGTGVWKDDLRPNHLLKEPFCRECTKLGHRRRATVVDHIKPHRGVWTCFIDPDNLQSLCKNHHDQKTAREQAEFRRENK